MYESDDLKKYVLQGRIPKLIDATSVYAKLYANCPFLYWQAFEALTECVLCSLFITFFPDYPYLFLFENAWFFIWFYT